MIDLEKLKALAKACNPEWVVDAWWASCDEDDEAFAYGPLRKCWPDAAEAKADTRSIAAASPAAVLEMIAELEKFDDSMRSLAFKLGAGGYSAVSLSADQLAYKVEGGLEAFTSATGRLLDKLISDRDQLKADNEALQVWVEDLALSLECEVKARYAGTQDHPAIKRKYDGDMQEVIDARALLASQKATSDQA